jgi:hypothetical protein
MMALVVKMESSMNKKRVLLGLSFFFFSLFSWAQFQPTTGTSEQINLAGKWLMSGRQYNVDRSDWEADLLLYEDGTLTWKETKGANVGAVRQGTWSFDGQKFEMSYKAPRVGLVNWQSSNVTKTDMRDGEYYTPESGPQPYGWGGGWKAHKEGRPVDITRKGGGSLENSIVLVIDASGSMGGKKIEDAKRSAIDQIQKRDENSEIAIVVFSDCNAINLVCPFLTASSANIPRLRAAVEAISVQGSTPLAAAVRFATEYMRKEARGKNQSLILLSDGTETCSGNPVEEAREINTGSTGHTKKSLSKSLTGRVTHSVGGSIGSLPKEEPLLGATVVIGRGLSFMTGNSGTDIIRGTVLAKVQTDGNGRWSAGVPAGTYDVIYWKAGYIPSVRNTHQAPGDHSGHISLDNQMQGLHRSLQIE